MVLTSNTRKLLLYCGSWFLYLVNWFQQWDYNEQILFGKLLWKYKLKREIEFYRTDQPQVLAQGTNEDALIILFWTHYEKTELSGKWANAGKDGGKEKKRTTSSKVERIFYLAMNSLLGDLKEQVKNRLSQRKIYLCGHWDMKTIGNAFNYLCQRPFILWWTSPKNIFPQL